MNVLALMTEPLLKADFANERVKLYLALIPIKKINNIAKALEPHFCSTI